MEGNISKSLKDWFLEKVTIDNIKNLLKGFFAIIGFLTVAFIFFVLKIPKEFSFLISSDLYVFFVFKLIFVFLAIWVMAKYSLNCFSLLVEFFNGRRKETLIVYSYLSTFFLSLYLFNIFTFNYMFSIDVIYDFGVDAILNDDTIFGLDGVFLFNAVVLLSAVVIIACKFFCNYKVEDVLTNKKLVSFLIVLIYVAAVSLGQSVYKMAFDTVFSVNSENTSVKRAYVIAAGNNFVLGRHVDKENGFFIERGGYSIKLAE